MSLRVEGVRKRFGATLALDGLDLEVPAGASYGLIGPNGAGKTTTMRLILSILTPDAGTIAWRGRPLRAWPRQTFGYLPEERGLYPRMVVREQMAFFGELRGLRAEEARRRADAWIERLALSPHAAKKASELSKGNGQKVQLAIALLAEPDLAVLDEPFSGLDPVNVRLMKDVIREALAQGRTLLFSSHSMEHVEDLCRGVCLIDGGRALRAGSVGAVRAEGGRRVLQVGFVGDPPEAYARLAQALAGAPGGCGADAAGAAPPERGALPGMVAPLLPSRVGQAVPPAAAGASGPMGGAAGDGPGAAGRAFDLPAGWDECAALDAARAAGTVRLFAVAPPTLEQVYVGLVGPAAHQPPPAGDGERPARRSPWARRSARRAGGAGA